MSSINCSAYVHVPFCRHRCGYCNFTLIAGRDDLVDAYLEALELELELLGDSKHIKTLFIGGGTPSHLKTDQLYRFFDRLFDRLILSRGSEFSVEANPSDISIDLVDLFCEVGVNRLSLGCQSFDREKLRVLERDHDAETINTAIALASERIGNVSIDLIFGVPGESRQSWESDLLQATNLPVQHISTYGLTFEKGTQFWSRLNRGKIEQIDEEDELWMYETAMESLVSNGFAHYEISNFAKPGFECQHNQVYWNGGEYFGLGPGAASHLNGVRTLNHRSTTTYIKRLFDGNSVVVESETLNRTEKLRERIVVGLRQIQGIDITAIEEEQNTTIDTIFDEGALQKMLDLGMLEITDSRFLRLTRKGLLVSDSIWPNLL